jgi:hypothetical protein
MKSALSSCLATATAMSVLIMATSVGAQPANTVGVDAMVRNAVTVKPAGAPSARPAVVRDAVRLGDLFSSGQASGLQILLRDHSVFTIGANARIAIDRFVYDPSRNSSDLAATITKGAFRFMSGPSLHGQGQRAINTPVATIGVRGTIVDGVIGSDVLSLLNGQPGLPPMTGNPDNITLIVLRGPGVFNEGFDHPGAIDVTTPGGGTIVLDQPGLAILIFDGGGAPFGPFILSDTASAQLAGLLVTGGAPGAPTGPGVAEFIGFTGSVGLGSGDVGGPTPPGPGPVGPGGTGGDTPINLGNGPAIPGGGGGPNKGGGCTNPNGC